MQNHQARHQRPPFGKHAAVSCSAGAVVSLIAAVAAPVAATSCATVTACIFGQNTRGTNGSGIGADAGVFGISLKGDGVDGETTLISTTTHAASGVAGYDETISFDNNGVFGYSHYGYGVHGTTDNGIAVYGNAVGGGVGVKGTTKGGGYGVLGSDSSTGTGVFGGSNSGTAVVAVSTTGEGLYASSNTGTGGEFSTLYGTAIQADADFSGSVLFTGTNYFGTPQDVVSIDGHGNEILAGSLTVFGTPLVRTATSSGSAVVAYTPRTSSPTLEDFGEAQLSSGAAYVPLDRTFASTIDQNAKYMVFLTPQGDNNGLYVTAISPRGFAVRESRGGHSTLAFDYRIVAKPYDTNAARLPPTTRFSGLAHNRAIPKRPPIPVQAAQ